MLLNDRGESWTEREEREGEREKCYKRNENKRRGDTDEGDKSSESEERRGYQHELSRK